MKQLIYDIETYPNYFCAGFEDYNSDDKWFFEISDWRNQVKELDLFLRTNKLVLIGYNNMFFDDPILNYIIDVKQGDPRVIAEKAQLMIQGQRDRTPAYSRFMKKYKHTNLYTSIDLMRLRASKALRVSLKEMEVSMCWPKVQDLPYDFNKELTREEADIVGKYNFNDIGATKELCKISKDDINLRLEIQKEFGLSCLSKDGVKTGVDLFAMLYEKEVGNRDFIDGRTPRTSIKLGDCISDRVKFKSKEFNQLLYTLKTKTITETKGALKYSVIYGGVKHDYGTGGIHSKDKPGIIVPPKGYKYMDADVNSLYPSLWIEYGWCPAHLDVNVFIPLYKNLRDTRLAAKANAKTDPKAKLLSDTYKLSLNGSYGNLINEYSWLYDPQVAMSITLNGQLFLSMLSERLTDAGFMVDSLNTDGITCMVPESEIDIYYKICSDWEKETLLTLEYAEYEKVIRRDVNAYLAVYKGGGVKEKGFFIRKPPLGKGYDKPIVKIALYEYFINNVPIEKTIREHKNIYDFCMMQKMGSQFKAVWNEIYLQKTNRFYASKGIGSAYLYKEHIEKGTQGHVLKDSGVTIFNDYLEKEIKDYQINYDYYIREAMSLKRLIEPDQLTLF